MLGVCCESQEVESCSGYLGEEPREVTGILARIPCGQER